MARVPLGVLFAVASALAYGSLAIFAKLAYAEGWNVPSLLVARFATASLVLLPLALVSGGAWTWRPFLAGLGIGGVGFAGTTALFFPSLQLLPAAVASFLLYLAPAFVVLLAGFFLRERLGKVEFIALALALGGLAVIASGAWGGVLSGMGVLLAATSAVGYAFTVVASRRLVTDLPWARSTLAVCTGALVSYLVFSLATGTLHVPQSRDGMRFALGLGAIGTALAMGLFFLALPYIGASRTSLVLTLEPVSTLALAAVVLDEIPSVRSVAGGALILAAAVLVAYTAGPAVGVSPAPGVK